MDHLRNYRNIDEYYREILEDIYPQPADMGHTELALHAIETLSTFITEADSVLDVGCGEAYLQEVFERKGLKYTGCCLGSDYRVATMAGKNVKEWDFSFIPVQDESYELIFARHALEHSPFPILTLMEWHRVSSWGLYVIMPNPDHYTFVGRNHYSVMSAKQLRWWLRRAGWRVISQAHIDHEFRYFCKKMPRVSYEGWAEAPLPASIHQEEEQDR